MDGIKRTAHSASQKTSSAAAHRTVQKSTTLNRKFVRRPVAKNTQIVAERKQQQKQIANVSVRASQAARRATGTMVNRTQRVKLSPLAKAQQAKAQQQNQQQAQQSQQLKAQQAQAQQQLKTQAQQQQRATRQSAQQQAQHTSTIDEVYAIDSSVAKAVRARAMARRQQAQRVHMTSQEMKERAISDALRKVSTMDKNEARQQQAQKKGFWQRGHLAAAICLALVSVGLLGYLVYLNLPDLSVRVAAMNSGIENAYPSYVPMNYRLQGLAKEDGGTVTMVFARNDGSKFTMIEKKSSWDSSALLNNFVKDNWGENYTVAKGQGLTIYISGSNAVWVNGGVMYQIEAAESVLSADDLHDIAISL